MTQNQKVVSKIFYTFTIILFLLLFVFIAKGQDKIEEDINNYYPKVIKNQEVNIELLKQQNALLQEANERLKDITDLLINKGINDGEIKNQ